MGKRTVAIEAGAIAAVADRFPKDAPAVMLNLLRYRDQAEYPEGSGFSPCTGRQAYYDRYAPVATGLVMAQGGRVVWLGHTVGNVVAPADERWDDVILVEYPSFASLQALFANPDYQAVVIHRTAALEDSRLIANVTSSASFSPPVSGE